MKGAILASLLLVAGPVAAAPDPSEWTRARVDSLTPEDMTRQLFGELSGLLYPDTGYNNLLAGIGSLNMLSFYSVPRAGLDSGLCETEWVMVHFAPLAKGGGAVGDPPVRPARIEALRVHFVWDLERAVRGGIRTPGDQARFEAACAARDPRRETRIAAQDPDDIVIGLRLLTELVEAARSAHALAPLDCSALAADGRGPIGETGCLTDIAAIRASDVDHVPPPETTPAGVIRRVHTPTRWLAFHFAPGETLPTWDFTWRPGRAVPRRVVVARPPEPPPLIIYD